MYKEVDPNLIKCGTLDIREDVGDIEPLVKKVYARKRAGKKGIAIPLKVKEIEDPTYQYEIIDGKRRLKTALKTELPTVPIVISDEDSTESLAWDSFDANDARLNNNWYELGKFFSEENDKGMTHAEIGDRAGIDRATVTRYINSYKKLCNVPRSTLIDSIQTAKIISEKANPNDFEKVIDKVIDEDLSWRDTDKLLDKVTTIREKIYEVSDNDKRDALFEQYEPVIYEDNITLKTVDSAILDAKGIAIWTSEKLKTSDKLIKTMEKFREMYPESCELEEGIEGNNMWVSFKIWINKSEFSKVNE